MPDKIIQKPNRVSATARLMFSLLAIVGLFVISLGTAEAGSMPHVHKVVSPFADQAKTDGHSCPLIHHPQREFCPLSHQSVSGVVIKNCGGPAEGVLSVTGFSKETVAPDFLSDSSLPLQARQIYLSTSFYSSLLSDPLDHPPKSL